MNFKRFFSIASFIVVGFMLSLTSVKAAQYSAAPVTISGSGQLNMQPGEVKEVFVSFLNTGDITWKNDGQGYISLYTYDPKYRKSAFDPGTWLAPEQVKRIIEPEVQPGEVATMKFELRAPYEEGDYKEVFHLASEDTAWIDGGEIVFNIQVSSKIPSVDSNLSGKQSAKQETELENGYKGEITVKTANSIKAKAGTPILFTIGVKNTGTRIWQEYSLNTEDVGMASQTVDFSHPSWNGSQLAYAKQSVSPGETAVVSFAFTAPQINGNHMANFVFYADGNDIADIEIPVEVTGEAAEAINSDDIATDDAVNVDKLVDEPIIRVGILIVDEETDNKVVITSDDSDYELRDTEGNLLAEMQKGQSVTAFYEDGYYFYDRGRGLEKSSYGLRFIPVTENAVMKIANFDYRETRNGDRAYNLYRNILELRYNDYKDRTWLINELPIEMYLRGLAETSNSSPAEYQKALITAARTYAYYHYTHGTKRGKEFMHLIAYADDQVYRGYDHEIVSPTITKAVEDTEGVVVTYDDELAITPYFSRSDGRTRDWSEVWYGSVPWLKSVPVPWEEGGTLWGHGVGLSALGALRMAEDGYTWDEILKYFYTGIDLTKKW